MAISFVLNDGTNPKLSGKKKRARHFFFIVHDSRRVPTSRPWDFFIRDKAGFSCFFLLNKFFWVKKGRVLTSPNRGTSEKKVGNLISLHASQPKAQPHSQSRGQLRRTTRNKNCYYYHLFLTHVHTAVAMRTHDIHKNLHIPLLLLTVSGPDYYFPP